MKGDTLAHRTSL